jgi:AcrR family transcriptional regulator
LPSVSTNVPAKLSPAELRRTILDCALRVGEELGQEGLTMRNIAKRMGVNQAALYGHYEDKASMLRDLTKVASERLEKWLAHAVASQLEPLERLFQLCLAEAEFARIHPWLYQLAFENGVVGDGLRTAWDDHPFVVRAEVLLRHSVKSDPPVDAALTARQLCVAIHGLAGAIQHCTPEPTFVECYIRVLLDGLFSRCTVAPARAEPAIAANCAAPRRSPGR